MIGDWVQVYEYDDDPMECGYVTCRVENINDFGDIGANCNDHQEKDVEPIPLTQEILEKNGFMRTDFLDYSGNRIGISLLYKDRSNCEEGFRVLIEKRSIKVETRTTIKPVKYVHEIQHTLKDLEIEKEIIL